MSETGVAIFAGEVRAAKSVELKEITLEVILDIG